MQEEDSVEVCSHNILLSEECGICSGKLACPICGSSSVVLHEEGLGDGGRYCRHCRADFYESEMVKK